MRRQDLEKSIHLKNDGFTIRCDIAIVTDFNLGDAGAAMRFVVVPPADIQNHLYNLLLSQEGADVTFQVGDEKFAAHRCVLAARSAVFKAELFGPMKEGTTDTVAIDDSPFRLLSYTVIQYLSLKRRKKNLCCSTCLWQQINMMSRGSD
jgi:speckle-type POZ protein